MMEDLDTDRMATTDRYGVATSGGSPTSPRPRVVIDDRRQGRQPLLPRPTWARSASANIQALPIWAPLSLVVLPLAVIAGCSELGCGATPHDTVVATRPPGGFQLILAADNGHVQSPLRLELQGNGQVLLDVGGPAAFPGVTIERVGRFGTTLDAAGIAELRRLIEAADIPAIESPSGPLPSGDYGSLVLTQDGHRYSRLLWQAPEAGVSRLLDHLRTVVEQALQHPVAAAQASLRAEMTPDGMLAPVLVLEQVGTESLPLLLYDAAFAGNYVHIRLELHHGTQTVPEAVEVARETIVAMVEDSQIAAGPTSLTAAHPIEIPLTDAAWPVGTEAEGTVMFWMVGDGPARSTALLRVPHQTVVAEPRSNAEVPTIPEPSERP